MGIKVTPFIQANPFLKRSSMSGGVPKGHCPVYVGENQKKRFVVLESFLSHPLFQGLSTQSDE
ncbi:hypothetical protein P3S67_026994 [Capsicum chacoense]